MKPSSTQHRRLATITALVVAPLLVASSGSSQIYLVDDIGPAAEGSGEFVAGALGSTLFFKADDGVTGRELWISDGTSQGTHLLKDIWPESSPDGNGWFSSEPDQFTAVGSDMYFAASSRQDPITFNGDYELWITDGSAPGTVSLDLHAGTTSSDPKYLVAMGGSLYLVANDETYGAEVFKVTAGSPSILEDIEPDEGSSMPRYLTVVDLAGTNVLFFAATDSTNGTEPWVSNGSTGGTTLLRDIVGGDFGSNPMGFAGFDGRVYFSAEDATHGAELWTSYGTEETTTLFADINPTAGSSPSHLTAAGGLLFFLADDGTHGRELWRTNGTAGGTFRLTDIGPGSDSGLIQSLTSYADKLFFTAWTAAEGAELWVSDGTADGTALFKDIYGGPVNGIAGWPAPPELVLADGLLFFAGYDPTHGSELWASNGTVAGTLMVADVASWNNWEGPKGLTAASGKLFFQTDSSVGRELHALPAADVVTAPHRPNGPTGAAIYVTYTFSTAGATSLRGNDVQYRFHWGDGTDSGWLGLLGGSSAEKMWADAGTYTVTAEASSTTGMSALSPGLTVVVSFDEIISEPALDGATSAWTGTVYDYAVTGESNTTDDLEYSVYWGDGIDEISWTPFDPGVRAVDLTHTWEYAGAYMISVGIRCATHTDRVHWVDIPASVSDATALVFADGFESGDTTAW